MLSDVNFLEDSDARYRTIYYDTAPVPSPTRRRWVLALSFSSSLQAYHHWALWNVLNMWKLNFFTLGPRARVRYRFDGFIIRPDVYTTGIDVRTSPKLMFIFFMWHLLFIFFCETDSLLFLLGGYLILSKFFFLLLKKAW